MLVDESCGRHYEGEREGYDVARCLYELVVVNIGNVLSVARLAVSKE